RRDAFAVARLLLSRAVVVRLRPEAVVLDVRAAPKDLAVVVEVDELVEVADDDTAEVRARAVEHVERVQRLPAPDRDVHIDRQAGPPLRRGCDAKDLLLV